MLLCLPVLLRRDVLLMGWEKFVRLTLVRSWVMVKDRLLLRVRLLRLRWKIRLLRCRLCGLMILLFRRRLMDRRWQVLLVSLLLLLST